MLLFSVYTLEYERWASPTFSSRSPSGKVAEGQASQLLLCTAAANWPAGQPVQLLLSAAANWPAGQAAQLLPEAYFPAAHAVHFPQKQL